MSQKAIIVEIGTDGSFDIDAVNFKGVECEKATKFLEDALGAKVTAKRKPEYATRVQQGAQQKAGQ